MKLTNDLKNKAAIGLITLAYADNVSAFEKRHKELMDHFCEITLGRHQEILIEKLGKDFIGTVLPKSLNCSIRQEGNILKTPSLRFLKFGSEYTRDIIGCRSDSTKIDYIYSDQFSKHNSAFVPKTKKDIKLVDKYIKDWDEFVLSANEGRGNIRAVIAGCSTDTKLIDLIPAAAQFLIDADNNNLPISVESLNSVNSIVNGGK